jgi:hypothetical protein
MFAHSPGPDHQNPSRPLKQSEKIQMTSANFNTMNTGRRAFLSNAASAAALTVAASITGPAGALNSDPIFAAIEDHKAACVAMNAEVSEHSRLESTLPRDKRRSSVDAWEEKIVATDDPRWIESARAVRQTHVKRLRDLSAAYTEANAKLPAWAQPGLDRIDQDGNACGDFVNWPLDASVTPPPLGYRFVRPSLWRCRDDFDFAARVFAFNSAGRKKARATMRARMRVIVARLRERKRLRDELGLTELNRQIETTVDALIKTEEFFHECNDETPNIVAARLMIGLTNDCQMAIALVVARGLVPILSGLIREHAAFFVANPELPLSAMPFASA